MRTQHVLYARTEKEPWVLYDLEKDADELHNLAQDPAAEPLRREMEAQFERYAQTGLPWDHVDGHQHFHMHPTVFRHLLTLCDSYGVNRLRVPRD